MNVDDLKDLGRRFGAIHLRGKAPDIAVFTTPRSGSTWFMELLASQSRVRFYDEPFNIRRRNVQKSGRFRQWEDIMPDTANAADLVDYVRRLCNGSVGHMNPAPFRRNYRPITNRAVLKLHAVEFLADVLMQEGMKVVCLLRHPIPTTLSRTTFPRLKLFLNSEYYRDRYFDDRAHEQIVKRANMGSHLEQGVISWCFENVDLIRSKMREDIHFITYEELVSNPDLAIRALASVLQLPRVDRILKHIDRPAANVSLSGDKTKHVIESWTGDRRKKYLALRWQDRVSIVEARSAMSVMDEFGIRAYQFDNPCPDEAYLYDKAKTASVFESLER